MYNGIINIYKEKGFTSHDVVAKMRGILKQKKIGHTGTLDPDAVGVLPVCLGSATKLCDMLTDRDKEYIAEMRLGVTTDTQDMTGTILSECPVSVTAQEAETIIKSFEGEYAQIPPMYSALKVDGKRLYELARQGKEVERKPRPVTIHEIEILSMELPKIRLRVSCSKGTYIRTLCHDIGKAAGCGGAMMSLERTRSGSFTKDTAITLTALTSLRDEGQVSRVLIPVDAMFAELGAVHVQPQARRLIENGNSFFLQQVLERRLFGEGEDARVYDDKGIFFGIYTFVAAENRFKPKKMFLEPGQERK